MNILFVTLGGAVGAICRYILGLAIMKKYPSPPIPIAMLIVNIIGSFGLGLFFSAYIDSLVQEAFDNFWYLFVGIGFFGAFTTFSTFSMEALELIRHKHFWKAAIYISCSLGGSILFFSLGYFLFL